LEVYCADTPKAFLTYMSYCRKLEFEQTPDYAYLKGLFMTLFNDMGFKNDLHYDWID
jgi:hypothetical protein